MKLRPRHAEPVRRTIARRGNNWLDRKVNRPLKPNTIRIRMTQELPIMGKLWIGNATSGITFHSELHNVSPDFMRLMYGGPVKVVPRQRPFDWKLDCPEVA